MLPAVSVNDPANKDTHKGVEDHKGQITAVHKMIDNFEFCLFRKIS
jgi:DNA-binding FrmR family transcriptional regulator